VANLIVVNPTKVSATTMREFIEQARRSPGKFTYASAGNGSGNHLGGAMLEKMAGIDLLHVPYKGGGPALTAVLSGEVDASVADPIAVLPHVKSGKLRALAVTSAARASAVPEVPTVAESGVPGYDAASWAGVAVRKDVPSDIVDRLYKAFSAALKSPDVAARLSERLYDPAGAGPQAFSTLIARENDKYARLIRQLDIQLD
jgi:tripartite-type tricarboxylate transporter receptor subunit TctC